MRALAWGLMLALLGPVLSLGAAPAGLVADRIFVDAEGRLVAEGNVLAVQGERSLSAARLSFDDRTGALILSGPILITEPNGTVIEADAAALDRDFRSGLIEGARLVLDQEVQIASPRITRIEGGLTAADDVVATSCRICGDRGAPIWQIRAERVIVDEPAERLWFRNARLELWGVPVFWSPVLSLPEPGVTRATGFLFPSLRVNTVTGTGVRLPYFITLGDHADLTVTPLLTTRSRTLELRYRQAFARGDLMLSGAVTEDETDENGLRAYLFAEGSHELGAGFRFSFDLKDASDKSYLSDYRFADFDRLQSTLRIDRARPREAIRLEGNYILSQREDEVQEEIPARILDARLVRYAPLLGGMGRVELEAHQHVRATPEDGLGRDVARAGLSLGWAEERSVGAGLRLRLASDLTLSYTAVSNDSAYPDAVTQSVPSVSLGLAWPLRKSGPGGAQLLEPFTQLGWSGGTRPDLPNEESLRSVLDEGNLLSFSRFPAPDRFERGLTISNGLRWQWQPKAGPAVNLIGAQLLRENRDADFTSSSGLGGGRESFLLAVGVGQDQRLALTGRAIWDNNLDLAQAESRLAWQLDTGSVSAAYVQLREDDLEGRTERLEEITFDTNFDINEFWSADVATRYDLAADQPTTLSLGARYRNECVSITLAIEQRYSTSELVDPSTDFGLSVDLLGFGARGQQGVRRQCDN